MKASPVVAGLYPAARGAAPSGQPEADVLTPAIDTRTYDWRVFDQSGWVYLLPPLRGSRLLCLDAIGNVAHRLAAEGSEVTVVAPPGAADWPDEFIDAARRPTAARLRRLRTGELAGAWAGRVLYDGIVVHDLVGSTLHPRNIAWLTQMFRRLSEHLDPRAFVYVGARRLWSPWRLFGRAGSDSATSDGQGVSGRHLRHLLRAAGTRTRREHPFLLSDSHLVEVLGARGYRSMKNRELRAERAKEMLLSAGLSPYLSPALGLIGYCGEPRRSVIDLLRDRLAHRPGEPADPAAVHPSAHRTGRPAGRPQGDPNRHPHTPELLNCLVLHAGKVVLGLGAPVADASPLTVVLTGEAVAIGRREAEAASLAGLAAALPPELASLVPCWRGRLDVEGVQAFVQTTRPGVTCDQDVPLLRTLTRAAAGCLTDLHRHTSEWSGPASLSSVMMSFCTAAIARIPGLSDSLSALRDTIGHAAAKLDFPRVWMHGDFKIENVTYAPDSGALTGVIDWELSMPQGLPLIDLLYLLAFNRMIRGQKRYDAFRALSLGERLEPEEDALISDYLRRLEIPHAQRLPLGIAFVCHDIGCRIQWDVLPPDALRLAAGFLDELRGRLLAWTAAGS